MTSPFAIAIAGAADSLLSAAGVAVTYRRGIASVELTAVPGQTALEATGEIGVVAQFHTRDYLIRSADLVLSGDQVEPIQGDQIVEVDQASGRTRTYEVMSPGADMPAWRYCDHGRSIIRIHTKLIEVTA